MEPKTGVYYLLEHDLDFSKYNIGALKNLTSFDLSMGPETKEVSIRKPQALKGTALHWHMVAHLVNHINSQTLDKVLVEVPTNDSNVMLLVFKEPSVCRDRETANVSGALDYWSTIQSTLEEYAERLGKTIYVSYSNRGSAVPPSGHQDRIYVRILSSPVDSYERSDTNEEKISSMFGLDIGGCYYILPTNSGYAIKSTEGDIVAEVVGNTLYILIGIEGGTNSPAIIGKIVAEYLRIEGNHREKKRLLEEAQKRIASQTEDNFVNLHRQTAKSKLQDIQSSLRSVKERIEHLGRELTQAVRKHSELTEEEAFLRSLLEDDSKRDEVAAKLKAMLGIPGVVDVQVSRHTVSVFTDTIIIRHTDGKFYEIGEFRIDMCVKNGRESIKLHNLANRNTENCHYHPHIDTEGGCCFGNISSNVYELLGEYEFYGLTVLLMTFLSSCNLPDAYCSDITKWPVVKEPKGRR